MKKLSISLIALAAISTAALASQRDSDPYFGKHSTQLKNARTTTNAQAVELNVGDFALNLDTRRVTVGGKEVHLTPKEFELLAYLMRHAGKVLTHRALLAAVWGGDYTEQTEYLRVFVGQLRKKIEAGSAKPRYIVTEPWVGYRFNPDA